MRYILTDDDGKIVMSITAGTPEAAALNLNNAPLHTGVATRMWVAPPDAGRIHDAHLFVGPGGVLTAYPAGVEAHRRHAVAGPSDLQHEGMRLIEVHPMKEITE